jgi:hypothetical protein
MTEHGSYISLVDDTVNYVHDILGQFFVIFLKHEGRRQSNIDKKNQVKRKMISEISQNKQRCETVLYHHPICTDQS